MDTEVVGHAVNCIRRVRPQITFAIAIAVDGIGQEAGRNKLAVAHGTGVGTFDRTGVELFCFG